VRLDEAGALIETTEKRVISNKAIAGLYYFKKGADFIAGAKQVLLNGSTVQGAYYVSQVINEMILQGKSVGHSGIDSADYFNLYSPQKLAEYEQFLRSGRTRGASKPVLLIPAAGEGSRFAKAGYKKPKPFIDVAGKPMILRVLENLAYGQMRSVVVARQAHIDAEHGIQQWFSAQGVGLVTTDGLTEGTACTVLLAAAHIDPEAPLIIANSDQIVDFDIEDYVHDCMQRGLDGSILCFPEPGRSPKWSYAKLDSAGLVTEVKEKQAISELATVGIYLFTKGKYFIDSALQMIARNERVNNEFYTCPVYNYAIKAGRKIGVYTIEASAMHGIGTPDDLDAYLPVLSKSVA
jgi:dTDP-glucose pyrophosphorylase